MSYATGEAAALALLRANANYDSDNTSRGNWRIVNEGGVRWVVLRQGAIKERERDTFTDIRTLWTTVIVVIRRFDSDQDTEQALQADVNTVLAIFDPKHKLNAGNAIIDAMIVSSSDTEAIGEGNRPMFYVKELNLEWQENTSGSYTE